MNETDRKLLLKIIEQTEPNFEGLEFMGDEYLNELWANVSKIVSEQKL